MKKFLLTILLILALVVPVSAGPPMPIYHWIDVYSTSTTLTAAQVIALNATPITLVSAQGSNTVIEFVSAIVTYDYGSAVFGGIAVGEDLVIEYSNGTDVATAVETTGFLDQSDDEIRYVPSAVAANTDLEACINKAIRIVNSGAITGGTGGEVDVQVTYRVYSTGF